MASTAIASLSLGNIAGFGEVLHAKLVKELKSIGSQELVYANIQDTPENWTQIKSLIDKVYVSLGLESYADIPQTFDTQFRIGDVVELENARTYVITGLGDTTRTFPNYLAKDFDKFDPRSINDSGKTRRPSLSKLASEKQEQYKALVTEVLQENKVELSVKKHEGTFKASIPASETFLQIGDLVFGVDPIQLSFTTQNGYQYFPTLRTSGNPKIPSLQQIKNISLTLIFPNIDAINFQLIPLFAMFKRTPFVNIKNRDLTKFYEEIASETGYVSVALESIQIQSIEGFPNSVQANITLLPFEPGVMSEGALKALKSFDDVYIQQERLDVNYTLNNFIRAADNKMQEESSLPSRFKDMISAVSEATENFKESLPFRAFYQSLIAEHKFVRNEDGSAAKVVGGTDLTIGLAQDISFLSPIDRSNFLHHYTPEGNRQELVFTYKYPSLFDDNDKRQGLRDVGKYLSEERLDKNSERLTQLENLKTVFTDYLIKEEKALPMIMFSTFGNMQEALRPYEYNFGKIDNIINQVLMLHNVDPKIIDKSGQEKGDIGKLFGFIFRQLLHQTGTAQVIGTVETLKNIPQAQMDKAAADMWALIGNPGLTYNDLLSKEVNAYGVKTASKAFRSVWEWIQTSPKANAEKIIAVLQDIARGVERNLIEATVILDEGGNSADSIYAVRRLPIKTESFSIDNRTDVMTAWSIIYSNKFVPIYLSAYKHPFYQHLGSEDITLSLSVISVPSDKPDSRAVPSDLKTNLSRLSDRLYDSVKLVMFTAPDLLTWMDPRIELKFGQGSIFHAFGIEKVVLNSSNSTTIQNMPDSWNTVINLTQANFSLEQYHSLSRVPTLTQFEAVLAHLIPRIKMNDKGEVSVYTFSTPNKILSQDEVLSVSFFMSSGGQRFLNHLDKLVVGIPHDSKEYTVQEAEKSSDSGKTALGSDLSGDLLLKELIPALKTYLKIDLSKPDEGASGALRTMMLENRKFADILKAIILEYNTLLNNQADAFINMITEEKETMSGVKKGLATWGITASSATVLAGLLLIPGLNIWAGAVLVGGIVGGAVGGALTAVSEVVPQRIVDKTGSIIQKMMSIYHKEMLLSLSHAIMKDPPIRKRLLDPAIIAAILPPSSANGEKTTIDLDAAITQIQNIQNVNCYKDFDIPVSWERDGRTYRASPDFYLYNSLDPNIYIASYVKDSTERLLKVGKMGIQLALVEHKALLERYDVLKDTVSQEDVDMNKVMKDIATELSYKDSGLNDSLIDIAKLYRLSVYTGEPLKTGQSASEELKKFFLTDSQKGAYIAEFERANAKEKENDPKLYKLELDNLKTQLDMNIPPQIQDATLNKLNIVWAARMKVLLELVEIASAIQTFYALKTPLSESVQTRSSIKSGRDIFVAEMADVKDGQLTGATYSKIDEIKSIVWAVLGNYKDVKTSMFDVKKIESDGNDGLNLLIKKIGKVDGTEKDQVIEKGMARANAADKFQLPGSRILSSEVYNKIGYYIRLNSAIDNYNANGVLSFDQLPELGFIDAYNIRNTEATLRQFDIEKQIWDAINRQQNLVLRMFPTFKVYFIEEDKGTAQLLDDYYAYNAVQSIEISKNKDTASSVAVLRLSNLVGTITDKLSLHREKSDFASMNNPMQDDEAFFGTLDIKPGTKIQIKMGYAADERYLPTVFSGRIIEMNVGPVTEMICQSYAAQLNHKVYAEKFGMFASQKEYGDIASALLDMIPGLENLGKKEIISFGLTSRFTGRDMKKIKGSLFNNFMLTSLLGRVTADLLATDNPRDENIYLPFNLSIYSGWQPKFDWVVYNQSVWEAIQELCLHSTNSVAVIKQYNNDALSQRNEHRETLVIGNKSGYYKFTDSLSMSSLNTDDIISRRNKFKEIIKDLVSKTGNVLPPKASSGALPSIGDPYIFSNFYLTLDNKPYTATDEGGNPLSSMVQVVLDAYNPGKLKSEYLGLWNWLKDPLNATIIKKRLLTYIDISIKNSGDVIEQAAAKIGLSTDTITAVVEYLDKFSGSSDVSDPTTTLITDTTKGKAFPYIAYFIIVFPKFVPKGKTEKVYKGAWEDMVSEDFFSVSAIADNINPALATDPRYKKIQQHHLVSDSTNLIANQIALNMQFANMINVYFFDEPQFIDGLSSVQPEKFDKLNFWPIKAFGNIKDDQLRILNTFQKNIDPWWFDIKESQEAFFKGYRRLRMNNPNDVTEKNGKQDNKSKADFVKSFNSNWGTFNLHVPDWRGFPSYHVVGVNLLKKEVSKMYAGSLQIIGDTNIEPLDIIHLEDYINDMHGVVEVAEVVHTFTPDTGLLTTITPGLITYDRDPIQMEDVAVINRIYDIAQTHRKVAIKKAAFGSVAAVEGALLALKGGQPILGGGIGAAGIAAGLSGLNGILGNRYHRFLYDTMGNVLGRDVINFTALIYHSLPYICGFDGVDYTSLKTLMVHKANAIENPIARISAFSDEFAASIYTNFNPQEFGAWNAVINKLPRDLRYLRNLPDHQQLNSSFWSLLGIEL